MARDKGKGTRKGEPRRLRVLRMAPRPPARPVEPELPNQTAIELLEELLQSFKDGTRRAPTPDAMLIFWMERIPETNRDVPHIWRQNCPLAQQIGYGVLVQDMALQEWRGEE